jgi:hypothetical protein
MISPGVLEKRESGKNLSDSVTEQSDDSSVTQDDSFRRFFRSPSFGGGRKGIYIVGPQKAKKVREQVTIEKRNDYKEPTILSS